MKIKAIFTIAVCTAIMLLMTISIKAQENYYGQTKVVLHNNSYFLIPDSYVSSTDLFPIVEGVGEITKAYKNNVVASNALFMSFKVPENDLTLKEMGMEKYMTDKMSATLNVKIARAINMNGRDTFFLRGETKKNYTMQTNRYGNSSSRSTSSTQVKLEVIMYVIKEGDYYYMSMYQTPTQYFPTNFRTFLEIQNSFTSGK